VSTIELEGRFRAARLLVAVLAAFAFGALVRATNADHYHSNCVGHGFVHGSSTSDGSFFSRVEPGCGSTWRRCSIYSGGVFRGEEITPDGGTTCNAWSFSFGSFSECRSYANVYSSGVFSAHNHLAHNWCG
jgi:hypothetical protein